jgi:hypothetical protein
MLICWMECLEMMPSWCQQINWGNCGTPWVNCAVLCERRLERTVQRPALLPVKTAQFTQFFLQVWRHTVKSFSLSDRVSRHQLRISVPTHSRCCMGVWLDVAFYSKLRDWNVYTLFSKELRAASNGVTSKSGVKRCLRHQRFLCLFI